MTGYQPIKDQYFLFRSVPDPKHRHFPLLRLITIRYFQDKGINLTHIESRPLTEDPDKYKFLVNLELSDTQEDNFK